MASQSGAEAEDNKRRDDAYSDGRTKCAKIPHGDREILVNQKANTDEIKRILYKRDADNRSLDRSMEVIRGLIMWLMFERTGTKQYTVELANDEHPTSVTITASDQGDKDGPIICYVYASHKTMRTSLELAVVLRPTKLKPSHPPGGIIGNGVNGKSAFESIMHKINSHSVVVIMDITPGKKDATKYLLSTTFNFTFVSVLNLLRRVGMIQYDSMVVCATYMYDKDPARPNRQQLGGGEAGFSYNDYIYNHTGTIRDLFSHHPGKPIKLPGNLVQACEAGLIFYGTDADENQLYKMRLENEESERKKATERNMRDVERRRKKWESEIRNRTNDKSVRKKKEDSGSCAVM
jgi:hypothetical protein